MSEMLAYAAGFVDGEGCFSISKAGKISLGIVNTSRETLEHLRDTLGVGVVQNRKARVNKNQFVYRAYGDNCIFVAKALLPYLIEKRSQAELLIHYRTIPNAIRISGKKGLLRNPDRAQYIVELKALKKKESTPIHV